MAAALMFIVGGVLLYSLTGLSPTVLAAQLTLDHVKCFAVHDADTPVDVGAGEQQYARDYGTEIHLPRPAVAGLQLVNMRRCFCGEGVRGPRHVPAERSACVALCHPRRRT